MIKSSVVFLRSYATVSDMLREAFGWNISLPFFTFGLFVALAFLVAAYILVVELKRKAREGIFKSTQVKVLIGKPPQPIEIIFNALFGFIIGFKLVAAILDWNNFAENPQIFIFSKEGNLIGGLILAALFGYLKYREQKQQQLEKPQEKIIDVYPHHRIGDIVVIAAIAGIAGAKIFSNFEEPDGWKNFFKDPLGNFFSGLTIYGGLFLGAAGVIFYAVRKKISVLHLGDAVAPALILAYGVGRMGCQVSGDGDWGIYNSAYTSTTNAEIQIADDSTFEQSLQQYRQYYMQDFKKFNEVPHKSFKAPSFIPRSWVAQNYAHNVNDDGVPIAKCDEPKCYYLPTPVFPTPIYEMIMCGIIFLILWMLRKKWKIPGMLFAFYIILTGLERYLIERIRVNNVLHFLGIEATQATFISVGLMLFGLAFMIILKMRKSKTVSAS